MSAGIEKRVQKDGTVSYRAQVYDGRARKRIRKTFPTSREAQAWRQEAAVALRSGTLTAPKRQTVRDAADQFIEDCRAGLARTRGGKTYKPAAIRAFEQNLRIRVLPRIGHLRFTDVRRQDVQALVDQLVKDGVNPSTIQTTLLPLQVMFRRAIQRGEVSVNPTTSIEKPAVTGRRERVVTVTEADTLLVALDEPLDRAVWATAIHAGLRRGELQALRCADVDLAGGEIHVRRGWDHITGEIATKSGKARRVPLTPELRDTLAGVLLDRRDADGNVKPDAPVFGHRYIENAYGRSRKAWTDAGLDPIDLHTARHTFASLMIAAGVNALALCEFMGHSSIKVTFDLYGHLMPGAAGEAATLLDNHMKAEREKARAAGDDEPDTSAPSTAPRVAAAA